jgi:desulfoferrodoxin-like iron-binding protein
MKTFVCRICNHIAFDEAPVDCAVCGSAIENFEMDEQAIRVPVDPGNPDESEKMHMPDINLSECCFDHEGGCIPVLIRVGEIEHVMESEHLIEFIDLYINKKFISRLSLTSKKIRPAALIHLSTGDGILSAIGHCNVHGSWITKIRLDS